MPIIVRANLVRALRWVLFAAVVVLVIMWLVPQARVIGAQAIKLGLVGTTITWLVTYATVARWDVAKAEQMLAEEMRRNCRKQLAPYLRPSLLPVRFVAKKTAYEFNEVHTFFRTEVTNGRLVILGDAGSGKSVLALRLMSHLLADKDVSRTPLLLDVATWNPKTDLWDWVAGHLADRYATLRKRITVGIDGDQPSMATVLADPDRVIPILDGFDTLPSDARIKALDALDELGTEVSLVLVSRTKAWRDATTGRHGLRDATTITVQPLEPAALTDYLRKHATPPPSRWDPVAAELRDRPDGPVASVLTKPRMAWLVYRAYDGASTTPDELLTLRGSMRDHLIDRFVATVAEAGRWPVTAVPRWLGVLGHLAAADDGQIRWWRLVSFIPADLTARTGRLINTAIFMLAAVAVGWAASGPGGALVVGSVELGVAVVVHFLMRNAIWRKRSPARVQLPRSPGMLARLGAALVGAVVTGIGVGLGSTNSVLAGVTALTVLMILVQLLAAPAELRLGTSPATTLAADRTLAVVRGLILGAPVAALTAVILVRSGPPAVAMSLAAGFGLSAAFGGLTTTAWYQFLVARLWLTTHGVLPWRTTAFLRDAELWGILRPVGVGHEFRDAQIQRRLTTLVPLPVFSSPDRGTSTGPTLQRAT